MAAGVGHLEVLEARFVHLALGRRVKNPHENNRSRCDVSTTKS